MAGEHFEQPPPPLVPDARSSALAGSLSAAVSTFATHPLDLVKTRLQVQAGLMRGKVPGVLGSLRMVVRDEGARALFSGITPALLGLGPALAVFFSSYNFLKGQLAPMPLFLPQKDRFDPAVPAAAASGAWVLTSVLTNPLWIVKVRMQTQTMDEVGRLKQGDIGGRPPHRSVMQVLRNIVKHEGVLGLFQGGFAACLGFPTVMLKFPLYEWLKLTEDGAPPGMPQLALASSVSASVSTAAFYPLEVIRSRMQRQRRGAGQLYSSPAHCFQHMRRTEGYGSFYQGLRVSLVRTVPNAIVALSSYELILRILVHAQHKSLPQEKDLT